MSGVKLLDNSILCAPCYESLALYVLRIVTYILAFVSRVQKLYWTSDLVMCVHDESLVYRYGFVVRSGNILLPTYHAFFICHSKLYRDLATCPVERVYQFSGRLSSSPRYAVPGTDMVDLITTEHAKQYLSVWLRFHNSWGVEVKSSQWFALYFCFYSSNLSFSLRNPSLRHIPSLGIWCWHPQPFVLLIKRRLHTSAAEIVHDERRTAIMSIFLAVISCTLGPVQKNLLGSGKSKEPHARRWLILVWLDGHA